MNKKTFLNVNFFSFFSLKVIVFIFSFSILNSSFNRAFAQTWQWGLEGSSSDAPSDMPKGSLLFDSDKDAEGNLYILSSLGKKDRHVGSYFIPSDSFPENLLLTSLDCNGKHRWSKLFSCGWLRNTGSYYQMSVSNKGDVYILAMLGGERLPCFACPPPFKYYKTRIDTDTIFSGDKNGYYLICYDTKGKYKWVKGIVPPSVNLDTAQREYQPIDVNADANGDACVLGIFQPGMPIPHSALSIPGAAPDTGQCSPYIITYSRLGNPTSVKMLKGLNFMKSNYLKIWTTMRLRCDIYTNGYYLTGMLDPRPPSATTTPDTVFLNKKKLNASLYLISYDNYGNQKWARHDSTRFGNNYILNVEPDPNEGVYIGGCIRDSNTFAGHQFVSELVKRRHYYHPLARRVFASNLPFAMKLDKNGNYVWSTHASGVLVDGRYPPTHHTILSGDGFAANENFVCLGFRVRGLFHFEGIDTMSVESPFRSILTYINKTTGKLMFWDSFSMPGFLGSTNLHGYVAAKNNVYLSGNFQTPFTVGKHLVNKPLGYGGFLVVKHGYDCMCDTMTPTASFSYSGKGTVNFKYTGTLPIDSIKWDFGDSSTSSLVNPTHSYHKVGVRKACVTIYTACGMHVYCDNINITMGIENNQLAEPINIYPNPAKSYFYIQPLKVGTELTLYNILGQKILTEIATKETEQISISNLNPGVYILQVKGPEAPGSITKILVN